MRIIAIANTSSGNGSDTDELEQWCADHGVELRPIGDDLTATVERALTEGPEALAVCGGDGTIRAVAGIVGDTIPLLPVPGGTFNHFARSLGIDDLATAGRAVTSGTVRDVGIGEVNGEIFLNTCVVGWYPEMVRTRERLRERLPRPLALVGAFAAHAPRLVTFSVDLAGQSRRAWSVWVGAGRYGLDVSSLTERDLDDVLDIRLLLAHARAPRVRVIADLVRGRLRHSDHLDRTVVDGSVTIRLGHRRVLAALDAEVVTLTSPLRLSPDSRRLRVLVPG